MSLHQENQVVVGKQVSSGKFIPMRWLGQSSFMSHEVNESQTLCDARVGIVQKTISSR